MSTFNQIPKKIVSLNQKLRLEKTPQIRTIEIPSLKSDSQRKILMITNLHQKVQILLAKVYLQEVLELRVFL